MTTDDPGLEGTEPEAETPRGLDLEPQLEPAWRPRWPRVLVWLSLGLAAVIAIGTFWRVDYYTIRPGDALTIDDRITVAGAEDYPPSGDIMLLFVRERARINLWEYLRASLDPEIDLVKREQLAGDMNPAELDAEARASMAGAKANASLVALRKLGYRITSRPGVRVLSVIRGYPVDGVLQPDDVLLTLNGKPVRNPVRLSKLMDEVAPGDELTVEYRRGDETKTATVTAGEQMVDTNGDGTKEPRAVLGVYTLSDYVFPVRVDIDTTGIGGPSAGLAMTLAIIDELTPGELTGGNDVAVTGEILPNGEVGEVGSVSLKAIAARNRGAEVLLVPACVHGGDRAVDSCRRDLTTARERAQGLPIVEVKSINGALAALRKLGGAPLPEAPVSGTAR